MAKQDIGVSAKQQAENELAEEERKLKVARYKEIMRDIRKAERVVQNLRNELEDREDEVGE